PGIFTFDKSEDTSIESNFILGKEEARFLLSIFYFLAMESIESSPDHKIQANKRIWIERWKKGIENEISAPVETDRAVLKDAVSDSIKALYPQKISLMFLESSLYRPFFPILDIPDIIIPQGERV